MHASGEGRETLPDCSSPSRTQEGSPWTRPRRSASAGLASTYPCLHLRRRSIPPLYLGGSHWPRTKPRSVRASSCVRCRERKYHRIIFISIKYSINKNRKLMHACPESRVPAWALHCIFGHLHDERAREVAAHTDPKNMQDVCHLAMR